MDILGVAKWYKVSPEEAGSWNIIDFGDRLEFMEMIERPRDIEAGIEADRKPWQGPDNG